nr:hypothetical protein [Tanacetum cinerariifolium]
VCLDGVATFVGIFGFVIVVYVLAVLLTSETKFGDVVDGAIKIFTVS